ncbi:AI-2E family transporter [Rhodobacteraceae bacterium 2376]|uniref:AI-2E family transporter n=2 Tax=Rhabdonatronobacter sediminivivens TaxID=2743469 RepID=A0A7Z0I2C5_9RHOB|nr:AI-2E family transporter [Rhabdonatronobacter sediminivivens]
MDQNTTLGPGDEVHQTTHAPDRRHASEDFVRRPQSDMILLTAGLLLLAYLLGEVLLLVFAAVLLAVGLDGAARAIAARLPVSRGWALVGVALGVAAVILGALSLSAARLVQQFQELRNTLVDSVEAVQAWLSEQGATALIEELDDGDGGLAGSVGDLAGHAMTFGMSAVGGVASAIILIVLTMFLAANPALYRGGLVRLVPPGRRAMAQDTLSALAHALRWWFLGQLASMVLLGITVGLGLLAMGIELWFALGVLTALLTFIPFLGPLIATVPIVAVGFAEGTQTGLIVLIGYIVIQNIEGNVLVPMIQQKAVDLAPALLISVQVLLSIVFGVVGLMLAAPLTIVAMVAVQKIWVEHTLGEKIT